MSSLYYNLQSPKDIKTLYQNKLDELPISYELLSIETSFGNTNVIVTGLESKPSLVLLHGFNSCAPLAIEAVIGLVNHYNIYAIDIVGQPNLSAEIRPDMKDDSYGQWMFEVLTRLKIWQAILVGISFGGFVSWKTLVFDEKRISKTFLIMPAGIVKGNPLKILWKVFLPIKLYKWRRQMKYIRQISQELFSTHDEFAIIFLAKVFLHFEMDFSAIPLIKKEEARKIKTPISIIAAADDLFFPGEKMLQRASKLFPSLQEIVLLNNSKHVPSQEEQKRIVKMIIKLSL